MGLREALALVDVTPPEWGASYDYSKGTDYWNTTQSFVHWGGNPVSDACARGYRDAEEQTLRSFERYHLRKRWNGIAYDFAIGNSGTIYGCRMTKRSAATGGDIDSDGFPNNREAEGICLLIGKGQKPTEAALRSLVRLLDALGHGEVYGHKESAQRGTGTPTACPGPDGMDFVRAYRAGNLSNLQGETMYVRKGDSGPNVEYWQRVLLRIAPDALPDYGPDGDYGDEMVKAVKRIASPNTVDGTEVTPALAEHFHAKQALALARRVTAAAKAKGSGEVPPHTHEANVELS